MKKILFCLLFIAIFLTSCTSKDTQSKNELIDNNSSSKENVENSSSTSKENDTSQNSGITYKEKDTTQNPSDTSDAKDTIQNSADTDESKNSLSTDNTAVQNISEEIKDYIINGQENKPEATKINWSKTFLNNVDVESLYTQYIANGGNDDLENFANYMTLNAPILNNWENLFEKDLYDIYGEKVARLEPLENDLYQAYITKDDKEVPYVVVSSRTGYFHG